MFIHEMRGPESSPGHSGCWSNDKLKSKVDISFGSVLNEGMSTDCYDANPSMQWLCNIGLTMVRETQVKKSSFLLSKYYKVLDYNCI